jgi:Mg2+/Co2+ transporter CorB
LNDIPLGTLFTVLLVLIVCSGFFSSSETGLMALNRYRLRHLAKQGHRGASLAQHLLKTPDRLIGLILLGNNLVNILAASIATVIAMRLLGDNGIWVSTLVMTIVVLIFAEVAPKTVAVLHPERIAYPASFVLSPLLKLLYPLVWLVNSLSNLVLKPFRIRTDVEAIERLNREELRTLVQDGGQIPNEHQRMLVNILDLEQATVDDVMVPRGEIIGIDLNEEWDEVLSQLTQTIYTRLPVYREDIDHVEGFLHIRTIITKLTRGGLSFNDLKKSVRKPYFIPEGTPLTRQLLEFQRREQVTLDDILEEIVGEYTSTGRENSRVLRKLADGNYLVDGTAGLRALNKRMNWNLPSDEARTLNGLLIEELEVIPEGRTSLRIGDQLMTIMEINQRLFQPLRTGFVPSPRQNPESVFSNGWRTARWHA